MPYMSLTYELRRAGSPVHVFFHDRFPNVAPMIAEFDSRLVAATTLHPPKRAVEPPYATIGVAIDYRLMYYFWAKPFRGLDAFKGARWSPGVGDPQDSVAVAIHDAGSQYGTTSISRLVYDFFMSLERLLAEIRPVRRRLEYDQETRLCRYCFVLGLFEERQRSPGTMRSSQLGPFVSNSSATVADLLTLADTWVDDLCQLSWFFYDRQRTMFAQQAWIHPKNTNQAIGAGADLLLDGYVIDFKTTVDRKLDPSWLYQVLGYVLLGFRFKQPVQGVGIYMVRQGVLVRWRLDNLLLRLMNGAPVSLEELKAEFGATLFK
jgi:hypothetical protein